MFIIKRILASIFLVVALTSCARDLSSTVYTSDSTLSLTLKGKILSVRPVTIKNTDQVSDNAGGMLAGGALGAVAASNVGKGGGQTTAIVAGAIVGSVAGAVVQHHLGKNDGFEYIIKVDTDNLKSDYYEGNASMRSAISSATTSGLITVVQGKDVILNQGQDVYVTFSDKRTRVIAVK